MSSQDPGWYGDPSGAAGTYRWWDGAAWTRWLSADADAAPPGEAPTLTPGADPDAPAGAGPAQARTTTVAGPVPHEGPGVRVPLAVAVVLGAVLVAVVAVGAVVSASAERLPSGPAVTPPSPTAARASLAWQPDDNLATIGELRVVLPAAPYACSPEVTALSPTFTDFVGCSTVVHEDYDDEDGVWSATTGVGLVPDDLVVEDDLKRTADQVFASLRGQFYSGTKTTVRKLVASPTDRAPVGRSILVSGDIGYAIDGLPSRYDRTLVVVVLLADGTHAAWFSSRPDDTPAKAVEVLDASVATLTAQ